MSLTIEQKDSNGNIVVSTAGKNDAVLVSSGYNEGDKLVFKSDEAKYIKIKLHDTVKEAIIYIPNGEFEFPIPAGQALRGF